jgi:hypothetical protein
MPSGFFLKKKPPPILLARARLLWFRSKIRTFASTLTQESRWHAIRIVLLETGVLVKTTQFADLNSWPYTCPDPKDASFLAPTHKAGAWLVTGNLKHLAEAVRNRVVVLSPIDSWSYLVGD